MSKVNIFDGQSVSIPAACSTAIIKEAKNCIQHETKKRVVMKRRAKPKPS